MDDADTPEPNQSFEDQWAALHDFADRNRRHRYGPMADRLRTAGPPPRLHNTPIILDTDIGGDPADAIALTCAARNLPELALVITSDEIRGRRARFARHLLDLHGRTDVPVVSGADLGNTRYWAARRLTPAGIPTQSTDIHAAVHAVCTRTQTPVRWVGMGPLSNLSSVLETAPELGERLAITQMGGILDNPSPHRTEHNFRLDPAAAAHVLATAHRLLLVPANITSTPAIAIDSDTGLYRHLAAPDAPAWARLLHAHLDQWFATLHPASMQHDPLALATALQLPFTDFTRTPLTATADAQLRVDTGGRPVFHVTKADHQPFWRWLTAQLVYDT
ncbi:nucleoside hydrolase [Nocardia carnea]|uniref:nucleoside hydrolase n=1 Tax=Nocardia carnea TaxID=37328 RepID=UPI0024579749|nr:nucleoside hydrolase [Nocardia carnea]